MRASYLKGTSRKGRALLFYYIDENFFDILAEYADNLEC